MEGRIPLIGEEFPRLEVKTTHGKKVLPDDFRGKWFVLFSHPADFTPVCTTEFVAFQKRYDEFKKLNTELIGLYIDQVFSHIKWIEWIKEKLGIEKPMVIRLVGTNEEEGRRILTEAGIHVHDSMEEAARQAAEIAREPRK